jgi:hypothetical protein
MSLITPPHNLTDVTMVLPSECPYGTVIPDDPELAASHGIPNAGKFPVWYVLVLLSVNGVVCGKNALE